MAKVKVVTESSIMPSYIQLDISLREARLLLDGHKNITNILKNDLGKAVEYAEKHSPKSK